MRIHHVYDFVNQKIQEIPDNDTRRKFFAHIYGVAALSEIYALKRGLNPDIAVTAAMLHDISAVVNGTYDDHGKIGAEIASEFLSGLGRYSDEEISVIANAIEKHTDDPRDFKLYDALLTEIDYLQNHLRNYKDIKSTTGKDKINQLLKELGIG